MIAIDFFKREQYVNVLEFQEFLNREFEKKIRETIQNDLKLTH